MSEKKEMKIMPLFNIIDHLHKIILFVVQNIEELPSVKVDMGDKIIWIKVEMKEPPKDESVV